MKVYILLHHEIMKRNDDYHADEMVFYILSSLEKAKEYMKTIEVSEYSWWEIQEQLIDEPEYNWPEHIGYYNRNGRKIKKSPFEKCLSIHKEIYGCGYSDPKLYLKWKKKRKKNG